MTFYIQPGKLLMQNINKRQKVKLLASANESIVRESTINRPKRVEITEESKLQSAGNDRRMPIKTNWIAFFPLTYASFSPVYEEPA